MFGDFEAGLRGALGAGRESFSRRSESFRGERVRKSLLEREAREKGREREPESESFLKEGGYRDRE